MHLKHFEIYKHGKVISVSIIIQLINYWRRAMSAAKKLLDIRGGMVISSSICIGDTLGLYKALDEAGLVTAQDSL